MNTSNFVFCEFIPKKMHAARKWNQKRNQRKEIKKRNAMAAATAPLIVIDLTNETKIETKHDYCEVPACWWTFPKQTIETTNDIECPLCLANMNTGDVCITTGCGHLFHFDGLYQWYLMSTTKHNDFTCPLCQTHLLVPNL